MTPHPSPARYYWRAAVLLHIAPSDRNKTEAKSILVEMCLLANLSIMMHHIMSVTFVLNTEFIKS